MTQGRVYLYVCVCVCYLFVCAPALTYTRSNKDTVHHSLHADSLILLALPPAACRCCLQAAFTSLFHHFRVLEVTPGLTDRLAVSQMAGTSLNAIC